jgi:hypothetical protein
MKKSKKVVAKISKFEAMDASKMNKIAGGSINYNASKSNTGNLAGGDATNGTTNG